MGFFQPPPAGGGGGGPYNSFNVYSALISQVNLNAPTVTVLQNSIGAIVWSYATTGLYSATLASAFPQLKTFFYIGNNYEIVGTTQLFQASAQWVSANVIQLATSVIDLIGTAWSSSDNVLNNTPFEIRVYP